MLDSRIGLLSLPYEILFEIMLKLDTKSIVNGAKSNKALNQICKDDYFWQKKLYLDYSRTKIEEFHKSFKQSYLTYMKNIAFVYKFKCLVMHSYFDYEPMVMNCSIVKKDSKYIKRKIIKIVNDKLKQLKPTLHKSSLQIRSDGRYDHQIILTLRSDEPLLQHEKYKPLADIIGSSINNNKITYDEDDNDTQVELSIILDKIEIY